MRLILTLTLLSLSISVSCLSRQGPVYNKEPARRRQTADFNEGGLPSNLPGPSKPDDPTAPASVVQGGNLAQGVAQGFAQGQGEGMVQAPPPAQGMALRPFGPPSGNLYGYNGYDYGYGLGMPPPMPLSSTTVEPPPPAEEEEEEDEPAPFGLEETILILVPQVKYKLAGFPKWAGASVKLSFPITIFFEELSWPEGFNTKLGILSMLQKGHFGRRRRVSRSILSLPPAESFAGGERATLIPKLERTLISAGVGGRACLLRSVCEVHEAELRERYGFFGEVLTHLFSISHSAYAQTHLPGYLEAEHVGRGGGDCSRYFQNCTHSLFQQPDAPNSEHCEKGTRGCGALGPRNG